MFYFFEVAAASHMMIGHVVLRRTNTAEIHTILREYGSTQRGIGT
jgi:hypothetical protein